MTNRSEESASMFYEIKAAKNQSLFREVNESLKEVAQPGQSMSYAADAICECADVECFARISLSVEEYERLRQHSTWFAVASHDDHVFPDVERVVERNEQYWIVEKVNAAAGAVEKLDPRKRSGAVG